MKGIASTTRHGVIELKWTYSSGMSWMRICILLLTISCSACVAPVGKMPAPGADEAYKTIYLVSHGWHAGIVLWRADIPDGIWPASVVFSDTHYLEVGWGDSEYYQTPEPHMGLILKAALLPTASVLHIVGFSGAVPAYFPYSEIIRIELSAAGFERLARTIIASFARDEAGRVKPLGPGLYGNSRFYLSGESYHLSNTCNVWTARALRSAGLPITPARAISVENLLSQARRFGVVVQSKAESSR